MTKIRKNREKEEKESREAAHTEKADRLKRGKWTIGHKSLKNQKKLENDGGVGKYHANENRVIVNSHTSITGNDNSG